MARDAIARQYDVDKNAMIYVCQPGKENYRPGTITFTPKLGKTLDLRKIRESIAATRLSGGTAMGVDYLEIKATGDVVLDEQMLVLKVAGTNQDFVLKEDSKKDEKSPLQRLRTAISSGAKVVSVTGRVEGWAGRFPAVLQSQGQLAPDARMGLIVTDFEASKK